jgi:hypothetical protein
MASVNQTRPHSVNQIGKTHSKPLVARHFRGTAWARQAMCELAFRNFYVLLTVRLSIILDNDQLDTRLLYFTIRLL